MTKYFLMTNQGAYYNYEEVLCSFIAKNFFEAMYLYHLASTAIQYDTQWIQVKLILTTQTKGRKEMGNFRDLFRSCQQGLEKSKCQTRHRWYFFLSPISKHQVMSQFIIVTNPDYYRLLVFISLPEQPLLKKVFNRVREQNTKMLHSCRKINPAMLKSIMANNFKRWDSQNHQGTCFTYPSCLDS